jgi:hypothetical protein
MAAIPDTGQRTALPGAATVYLHKTGRVAESLDYTAARSHPYLKLFHAPPEDNPYMWNTKVISTQKLPWNRRSTYERQNPYALTGTGVNFNYPAEGMMSSVGTFGDSGYGTQGSAYWRHQQVSSPRATGDLLGGSLHRHRSLPSLLEKTRTRCNHRSLPMVSGSTQAVPTNPMATDGYWLPDSKRKEHMQRTWGWQR